MRFSLYERNEEKYGGSLASSMIQKKKNYRNVVEKFKRKC